MRMIHCADLHLDASMKANFDSAKAKERRAELLYTFVRMVDYAAAHRADAILIAGDLFDKKEVLVGTRRQVLAEITDHPEITFFYLKGNHDRNPLFEDDSCVPENLKLFGTEWTSYRMGRRVCVSGIELCEDNASSVYGSLFLDAGEINLVLLHGQESKSRSRDRAEVIDLKSLKNRGIDYLALGHVHAYRRERLDARGIYCYPGCLEGRGFDECGVHGFVVLDIDEERGTVTDTFVPFAQRTLYEISVDVTDAADTMEMESRVWAALERTDAESDDLVKLVLTGALDVNTEKNVDYLRAAFRDDFYFVRLEDETVPLVRAEDYLLDESLKGEFVRLVMASEDLKEADKAQIIRYGFRALAGEEI